MMQTVFSIARRLLITGARSARRTGAAVMITLHFSGTVE
jgi:hypothetical protein